MINIPVVTKWWAGVVVCRTCGDRSVSVMPVRVIGDNVQFAGLRHQEFPRCGGMTCDPDDGDEECER